MVILAVVWSNLIKPFVIKLCKISDKELFLNTVLCDNFGRSMIKSNQAFHAKNDSLFPNQSLYRKIYSTRYIASQTRTS